MKKKVVKKPVPNQKKISIVPLGDRVLVRPLSPDEVSGKTVGGIIIPDTLEKEKPEQGKVLAVGEGKMHDGKKVPVSVKAGDTVIFSKYAYDEIKVEGEEYYMLKEDNILAIIK